MKRVAVVMATSPAGEKGGAERFYEGLCAALNNSGVEAEPVEVMSDETDFEAIEETLLRFYDLDLSAYEGVISTKAPSFLVRHPNHICYLLHTVRVFYDMFDLEFPNPTDIQKRQRALIWKLDTGSLSAPRTRKIFTIGNAVSRRLLMFNGLESEVLHPALSFDSFQRGQYKYLFMPGRLHRWKRADLVIKAMQRVKSPVILKIAGTGDAEAALRGLAKGDHRTEFLGRVSDRELVNLFADALAVPFVPINEDFGYVTLEAFRSGKPVITCVDSGEPTFFVKDGETGFVCRPDPLEIAEKIDHLFENPEVAKSMGEKGEASIRHIRWENVAQKLLSHLL